MTPSRGRRIRQPVAAVGSRPAHLRPYAGRSQSFWGRYPNGHWQRQPITPVDRALSDPFHELCLFFFLVSNPGRFDTPLKSV